MSEIETWTNELRSFLIEWNDFFLFSNFISRGFSIFNQ